MTDNLKTMTTSDKIKTVVIAFSALLVNRTVNITLGYIISEAVIVNLVSNVITIVLGGLYISTVLKYPKEWNKPPRAFLLRSLATILMFVLTSMFTSTFLLTNVINDTAYMSSLDSKAALPAGLYALSLCTSIIIAPITEEIMYRGFLYKQLTEFNKTTALIISSIVFALCHGTIIHLYTALLGGLILGCIYEKTKKLRYSIIAHIKFNGLSSVLCLLHYPAVFTSVWFIVIMNVLCVGAMVMLFKTEGTPSVKGATERR